MERFIVEVPPGIRYLSQWGDFNFRNFQGQKVIINKQITGCGFTEFALTCPEPVVLSSPRNMLMLNKKDQHGEDVFLVINKDLDDLQDSLEFDPNEKPKDKPEEVKKISKDEVIPLLEEYKKNEESVYIRIRREIKDYLNYILPQGKAPKIIVTYDSTYIVKRILTESGILQNYFFVVDEFQSVLDDARFKAGTELEFMNTLQDIPNVIFVSATPLLDKYLEMIDEFKNLPYYFLDWGALDSRRIQKPVLKIRGMKSIISEMKRIIQSYLDGNYERVVMGDGKGNFLEIESKEAVLYVNSVNHIIRIIKNVGLTPNQVNILCSNTPENRRKIEKKLGKKSGFNIGSVPKRGEIHKPITLCTRTVYLGADFYSTNARSFIFSDANSDCLSIDISMDLPQILGRQRLDENPWKNHAEFYYKFTADYKKMTQKQLMEIIKNKEIETMNLLSLWGKGNEEEKQSAAKRYLTLTKVNKYKEDYVSVDRKSGNSLVPCFNNLIKVNELRTFEIQQVDYADRFAVISKLDFQFPELIEQNNEQVINFFKLYDNLTTYVDRLKLLCEFTTTFPELISSVVENMVDTDKVKQHFIVLGPEKIMSLGYNLTRINQAMGIIVFDRSNLDREIHTKFKPGDRYSKANLKTILGNIYDEVGYKATPKANDIGNWFEVKQIQFTNKETGKRDMGFELLKSRT